tara:strand:+ start:206 stop:472 length:267 start_codon:yes stop_codon:yes gene_type:complete
MNKKKITDYIVRKLNKLRPIEKKYLKKIEKFDFISSGHIDSIEILKFNFEIENKFKISIKPIETISKNYSSVGGLSALIYKKLIKKTK